MSLSATRTAHAVADPQLYIFNTKACQKIVGQTNDLGISQHIVGSKDFDAKLVESSQSARLGAFRSGSMVYCDKYLEGCTSA